MFLVGSIAVAGLLFFLRWPGKGLALLLFLLPFSVALNPARGIDLQLLRLLVPLFWFAIFLKYPKSFLNEIKKPLDLALGLFLVIATLSTIFASEPLWSLRKLIYLWSFAPLLPAMSVLFAKKNNQYIWTSLLAGGVLASMVGIVQFTSQFFVGTEKLFHFFASLSPYLYGEGFGALVVQYPSWFVRIGDVEYLRAFAFFPDPHIFAFYLTFLAAITLALLLSTKKKRSFVLLVACYLLLVICLLLTFSRGGYGGFLISTIVVLVYIWRTKMQQRIAAVFAIGVGMVILALSFQPPFIGRFISSFDVTEGSNVGRIYIWRDAFEKAIAQPLGVGLGNYALAADSTVSLRNPVTAHNLYLDVLVETGIFGLLSFLFFLFMVFRGLFIASIQKGIFLGFFAALVGFSAHAFFENPLYAPAILILLLLGAAFSAHNSGILKHPSY